jgi:uncharacterized membrane protein
MNKSMARITAIMGMIFGGFTAWFGIYFAVVVGLVSFPLLFVGLAVIAIAAVEIVLGGLVLGKLSVNRDFNGLLIGLTVFSFFGLSLVVFILGAIAIGSPKDENLTESQKAVLRFKQYLADGIIDRETYDKKVRALTETVE